MSGLRIPPHRIVTPVAPAHHPRKRHEQEQRPGRVQIQGAPVGFERIA